MEVESGLPASLDLSITEVSQILELSKDTLSTWIRRKYIIPNKSIKGQKRVVYRFSYPHLLQLMVIKILEDNLWLSLDAAATIANHLFPTDASKQERRATPHRYRVITNKEDPRVVIEIPLEFKMVNPRQFEMIRGTRKERKSPQHGKLNSPKVQMQFPNLYMTIPREINNAITISICLGAIEEALTERIKHYVE